MAHESQGTGRDRIAAVAIFSRTYCSRCDLPQICMSSRDFKSYHAPCASCSRGIRPLTADILNSFCSLDGVRPCDHSHAYLRSVALPVQACGSDNTLGTAYKRCHRSVCASRVVTRCECYDRHPRADVEVTVELRLGPSFCESELLIHPPAIVKPHRDYVVDFLCSTGGSPMHARLPETRSVAQSAPHPRPK